MVLRASLKIRIFSYWRDGTARKAAVYKGHMKTWVQRQRSLREKRQFLEVPLIY